MRLDEFLANRDAYRSEPDYDQAGVRDTIRNILERYYSYDGDKSAYELLVDNDLDQLDCCKLAEIAVLVMSELRSFLVP